MRVGLTMTALLTAALSAASIPARAQTDGAPVPLGTYRVLRSAILGEDRVLQVHVPEACGAAGLGCPVVYVFYSDQVEGYFAQVVNDVHLLAIDRMPPAIVVGVRNTQRYRDLLPWPRPGGQAGDGRADLFLRFVREELIPFVDRQYRTKPYRVLVGPQTAAVFGAYALLEAPGVFQAFIVNDPCQADGAERSLCRALVAFSRTPAARRTYVAVSHHAGERRWSPEPLRALRSGLDSGAVAGFRSRVEVVGDWPFFLAPVRSREALADLFRGYPFPSPALAGSLARIRAHYDSVSVALGVELEPPDVVLTLAGGALTESGGYAAALEILNHLAALYPSSLNGPWQLANLHRLRGDTAQAVRYYEECLRREPNMAPAREWIRRLGGGRSGAPPD